MKIVLEWTHENGEINQQYELMLFPREDNKTGFWYPWLLMYIPESAKGDRDNEELKRPSIKWGFINMECSPTFLFVSSVLQIYVKYNYRNIREKKTDNMVIFWFLLHDKWLLFLSEFLERPISTKALPHN